MNHLTSVCVFCGASAGVRPIYRQAAAALGRELGARRIRLIYGGGSVGLMGELARSALQHQGEVIGVIPQSLTARETSGEPIGRWIVVDTMHERKATMAALADAFIALPGGFGTLEELFESITWGQLGIHRKPIGILNVAGYFDPLLTLIDHAIVEGFIAPLYRGLFVVADTPATLLDRLAEHETPPGLVQWLSADET